VHLGVSRQWLAECLWENVTETWTWQYRTSSGELKLHSDTDPCAEPVTCALPAVRGTRYRNQKNKGLFASLDLDSDSCLSYTEARDLILQGGACVEVVESDAAGNSTRRSWFDFPPEEPTAGFAPVIPGARYQRGRNDHEAAPPLDGPKSTSPLQMLVAEPLSSSWSRRDAPSHTSRRQLLQSDNVTEDNATEGNATESNATGSNPCQGKQQGSIVCWVVCLTIQQDAARARSDSDAK